MWRGGNAGFSSNMEMAGVVAPGTGDEDHCLLQGHIKRCDLDKLNQKK